MRLTRSRSRAITEADRSDPAVEPLVRRSSAYTSATTTRSRGWPRALAELTATAEMVLGVTTRTRIRVVRVAAKQRNTGASTARAFVARRQSRERKTCLDARDARGASVKMNVESAKMTTRSIFNRGCFGARERETGETEDAQERASTTRRRAGARRRARPPWCASGD